MKESRSIPKPRTKRAIFTILIAIAAYCLAYVAAWKHTGWAPRHARYRISTLNSLLSARDAVEEYRQNTGTLPATLADLTTDGARGPKVDSQGFPLDIWGNRVTLSETDDGYWICSFGRDGQPGGFGIDGDLCADTDHSAERQSWNRCFPTFSQFAFELSGWNIAAACALFGLVAIVVYLACTSASRKQPDDQLFRMPTLTEWFIAVAIFAIVILVEGSFFYK